LRNDDVQDVAKFVFDQSIKNVHTNIIGRVEKVNGSTVDVMPSIRKIENGSEVSSPLFKDVPVITLQGGGSYDSYPIAVGDYCILYITEDCLDRWYEGEDDKPPIEDRHFDYSDSFALVGLNQKSNAIPIPSVATVEGERECTGDHTFTGGADIIINGISLIDFMADHTHGGVTAGGSNTADPNPLP